MLPLRFRFAHYNAARRPQSQSVAVAAARCVGPGLLVLLASVAGRAQQQGPQSKDTTAPIQAASPLAFTDVTVVDVQDGQLLQHQPVLVTGNRVQAVGNVHDVKLPRQVQVVDGRGKYLIPGLWDMHVHVWGYPQVSYPLFIANGVTGVREMSEPGNGLDSMLKWRREIMDGVRIGPRIVGTGGTVFSEQHPGEIMVRTVEDARRVVDSIKAAGADFVKFHEDNMAPEVYYAIAAEAQRIGIPLVGHRPNTITEIDASNAGQRTVEHFNEIHCWWPANAWPPSSFPSPDSAGMKRCIDVAQTFARNHTWFVPTLTVSRLPSLTMSDQMRYWPASVLANALALAQSGMGSNDPTLERALEVIRLLHQFGMPILAGTDTAPVIAQIVPGFSLHDELASLVEAGLTPLESLQAATLNPAKLFNATDSLGTVAKGKLAGLVLLDANPLADIGNTTKIRAVVANGHYFDRAALDEVLAGVERAAVGDDE